MQQPNHFMAGSICLGGSKDPSKELGASLVYNPYYLALGDNKMLDEQLDGYKEASPIVRAIVREYVQQKKIIGSYSLAHKTIKHGCKDGIVITDDDIMWAYTIGAGGGMEYEWPYE
jgi:hypothetical protein